VVCEGGGGGGGRKMTETGKCVAFKFDQFDFSLIFIPQIHNNLKVH